MNPQDLSALPSARRVPARLFILLHGVGADAESLRPVAALLQREFPGAVVESPEGFSPFDSAPGGRQWFSIRGVNEQNRPGRVAEALPALTQWIRSAQERHGVPASATTLLGFSQGAIMALEATAAHQELAGRVVALAGRYATLPERALRPVRIHLVHGEDDAVIPIAFACAAFERLRERGGGITLDRIARCGHELPPAMIGKAIERLKEP